MALLKRFVRALALLLFPPFLVASSALALLVTDLVSRRRLDESTAPAGPSAASIVIPNWNGKDLLEKYLPCEAMRSSGRELEPLGGWKADQSTCRDLGSINNTMPLLRPKLELAAGSASLFAVSAGPDAAGSSSFLSSDSLGAAGLAGFPNRSASLFSRAEPSRSVKTASASFESVTTGRPARSCGDWRGIGQAPATWAAGIPNARPRGSGRTPVRPKNERRNKSR
jgi:hypothetical protein